MSQNHDALRDAVRNLEAVLCDPDGRACIHGSAGDLEVIDASLNLLRQALAASKPQPQAEPEVVAWGMPREDGLILDVISPEEYESYEGDYTIPLIALQSHREVMQEKALQYVALFGQLQEAQEAIAKKDAALDACVGAMNSCDTKVKEIWSERRGWHDIEMQEFDKSAIDAAIEQAKEARG
ncbi:hypothetical protein UFOVP669_25 [uncultured Caudovirales phage]|uniref:Uncharacterized protein n=1 Tax=uncultured Caudovirales phage TaxID=2100421 RepID=A0A6J5SHD9_9CAUD|nr:hypothetical protein UFOVP400_16 [uncultured Caudovirales phage]CAB4155748.1 hypothetical protein UFOVP669_25 [uncultured Caudovirales phage]CAB4213544.1 hypothetical protein UFOVP1449_46 [uncultured Caudovirales phage]